MPLLQLVYTAISSSVINSSHPQSSKLCPHAPSLFDLHWLPFSSRIRYKTALTCFHVVFGTARLYRDLLATDQQPYSIQNSSIEKIALTYSHVVFGTARLYCDLQWLHLYTLPPSRSLRSASDTQLFRVPIERDPWGKIFWIRRICLEELSSSLCHDWLFMFFFVFFL